MSDKRKDAGRAAERFVQADYENRGYRLLAANWRDRSGELDLVFRSPEGETVFTEVRSQTILVETPDAGTSLLDEKERWALESIGPAKQRQIRRLARTFLHAHHLSPDEGIRFDAAAVLLSFSRSSTRCGDHIPNELHEQLEPAVPFEQFERIRISVIEAAF